MNSFGKPQDVVAIMGPTASGKTALAIALARELHGELINADSRQAIAELTVGVCKPSRSELGDMKCHGLDWSHLGVPFTAVDFAVAATARIQAVWKNHRVPIVVGGTGMYVRALLEGFDFGGQDYQAGALRRKDLDASELEAALTELGRLAPSLASYVDPNNPRRVSRALEMARDGVVPSRVPAGWRSTKIGCRIDAPILRERIRARTQRIMGDHFLQEVEDLLASGRSPELLANAAIGYREALAWLSGEMTRDQAVQSLELRTWRYARTQMTWLRREPDLVWIDATADRGTMVKSCLALLEPILGKEFT